ncbi:MAG: hypothetical protein DYG98_12520 [Haliscomenobacteraceae bacterium CHB4]|nr:hypothetical protein [Saprospiraceae bacterium]MCE7923875.1 hypothetical protein [Haliscomenobacteraceae bacterium CHB4]
MKKIITAFFALSLLFASCEKTEELFGEPSLKGKHVYAGGETKVKVGSWSTEKVGNGRIEIDLDAGTFKFTAGSVNTKTELEILFGAGFTNEVPKLYSFEQMQTTASGDYWRDTSSDIFFYSQIWGSGQLGYVQINNLTEDIIEGEYEFKGTDIYEDFKERTVQGSFSIPRE